MVTMKVMYVHRWVERRAGDVTLEVIEDLRKKFKKRKNTERLDWLFHEMQAVSSAHLAAPIGAMPPAPQQGGYVSGWKMG